jgi:hypothetical protein
MAGDTTKYVETVLVASNDPASPVAVRECGILRGTNSLHVTCSDHLRNDIIQMRSDHRDVERIR